MNTFNPNPSLPNEIRDAAEDGSLVLFIGAGISRLAGGPSWGDFAWKVLEQLTPNIIDYHEQKLISSIPDPRKQLSIAKIIEEKNDGIQVDYNQIFDMQSDSDKGTIYDSINKYNCSFVTTNYDKLIKPESSITKPENDWRFYNASDMLSANIDLNGSVLHLHGCIDEPSRMIISTKDYLNHYIKSEIPIFLSHLFTNKTVLFLGYGLEELEILEYILKNSGHENPRKSLFILQGFFNADFTLFDRLKDFYKDNFQTELIGFPLDYMNYQQQEEILKNWLSSLTFGDSMLSHEAALMMRDLSEP